LAFSASLAHKEHLAKRGVIINLEGFERKPDRKVKVRASIFENRSSWVTYEYTLAINDGVYKVIAVAFPDYFDFD
jgi:ABC-type transporter MlaC component